MSNKELVELWLNNSLELYLMEYPKDSLSKARLKVLEQAKKQGLIKDYHYNSISDINIIKKDKQLHWGSLVGFDKKYRVIL